MALITKDRVKETTTVTGTGTATLLGAATGFRAFSDVGNGNTTFYTISGQGTSEWEVGIGTYTLSGTTLARTTVLANSLGTTALISFSAGTKDVFLTLPAESAVYEDDLNTAYAGQLAASNGIIINNKTIAVSYSIPSGYSANSTGPITIASGQTVTVPTGSKWVVL